LRVMGIDPGLRVTGWGVIETGSYGSGKTARPTVIEAGVVRTSDSDPLEKRLNEIYIGLREVIDAHLPAVVAVEDLYSHYRHPKTSILMGHARGVVFLAAAQKSIPVVTYSATRIKKCIAGNGRAAKSQLQHMVASTLGLDRIPEPPDVSDALAAALTHVSDSRRSLS